MKIEEKDGYLVLKDGILSPSYEIEIASVSGWRFVAEENGAIYYALKLPGSTQNVSITTRDPDILKFEMDTVSELLGMEPEMEIVGGKFSLARAMIAADTALSASALALLLGCS